MSSLQPVGLSDQGSSLPQWSSELLPASVVSQGSTRATTRDNDQPCVKAPSEGEYHEHAAIKDPPIKAEESRESTDAESALSPSENEDDQAENVESPASLTEQYNLKHRMKRFRLNHHQTRFLMNEFARHPHPDASQREKISQEIPGLSARQVQVWFQNRRAKMKRLTEDDRERMMQSRALPEGFDASSALHSNFARPAQPNLKLITSLSDRPILGDSPFSAATLQDSQYANSAMPQSGTNSPFTEYDMTTTSVLNSPSESIISPTDSNCFSASPFMSQESSPGTIYPFERKRSLPFNHHTQPPSPMTRLQHGMARLRADSLGLPPRPSSVMQHSVFRGLRHHSSMVGLSRQMTPQRRPPLHSSVSFSNHPPLSAAPPGIEFNDQIFQLPSGINMTHGLESKPIYENPPSSGDQSCHVSQGQNLGIRPVTTEFAHQPPIIAPDFHGASFEGQQPMYQNVENIYYQPMMPQ